jgi:phosphatidylserine/phosphatidylglycerophosphate/cardiolipin synthase-like enzyme
VNGVDVRTLTDGGQPADDTANALAAFVGAAEKTLEVAIYDINLPDPTGAIVRNAFTAAHERGVAVRLAYNADYRVEKPLVPPPPTTVPAFIEAFPFATQAIPGIPDLMHHKYVVRDGAAVWTGSTNWTIDSWTREENILITVESAALAAHYLEDFEQLWTTRQVSRSGKVAQEPVDAPIHAWFCPGRGEQLARRIAHAIAGAERRVRIASPVISSAPVLTSLEQVVSAGKIDIAGVVDATQIAEVLYQWHENETKSGIPSSKSPLLRTVLTPAAGRGAPFSGKVTTPYAPGSVHDYMHAKVTVADDTVFLGSFNLSHSGEMNAENVLEIADAGIADQCAAFIDSVRGRYPAVSLPSF